MFFVRFIATAWLLGVGIGQAQATGYQIVDLGTFGGASRAYALNDLGQVVGESSGYAFLYSGGTLQNLGTLGGSAAAAYGINNSGFVVGSSTLVSGDAHAFSWNGTLQDLGTLTIGSGSSTVAFRSSAALDINVSGRAVGSSSRDFPDPFTNPTMVEFADGTVTRPPYSSSGVLYAVNDSGQMVGTDNGHGIYLSGGGYAEIPAFCVGGFCGSDPRDISDASQIVGSATTSGSTNNRHAFSYSMGGPLIDLGTLGGSNSAAHALNELGQIVGWSDTASGRHAFLYQSGGMTDLNTLSGAGTGWTLTEAFDINESGQVVGWGTHNGQTRAFLMTPIPEPTAAWLMLAGLALLPGWVSRQCRIRARTFE